MGARPTADEERDDAVSIGVIHNDIGHLKEDIAEIKSDFRDFRTLFATKDALDNVRKESETRDLNTNKRINSIFAYGAVVLGIITAALLGAALKLILKV